MATNTFREGFTLVGSGKLDILVVIVALPIIIAVGGGGIYCVYMLIVVFVVTVTVDTFIGITNYQCNITNTNAQQFVSLVLLRHDMRAKDSIHCKQS